MSDISLHYLINLTTECKEALDKDYQTIINTLEKIDDYKGKLEDKEKENMLRKCRSDISAIGMRAERFCNAWKNHYESASACSYTGCVGINYMSDKKLSHIDHVDYAHIYNEIQQISRLVDTKEYPAAKLHCDDLLTVLQETAAKAPSMHQQMLQTLMERATSLQKYIEDGSHDMQVYSYAQWMKDYRRMMKHIVEEMRTCIESISQIRLDKLSGEQVQSINHVTEKLIECMSYIQNMK